MPGGVLTQVRNLLCGSVGVYLAFPFTCTRLDVEGHRLIGQDFSDFGGRHFDEFGGIRLSSS